MNRLKVLTFMLCMCAVFTNTTSAFASQPEADLSNTTQKDIPVVASYEGYVIGNNVNIRSGPGTNYSSYGQVNKGDTFEFISLVADNNPTWVKVKMTSGNQKGTIGYIVYEYLMW